MTGLTKGLRNHRWTALRVLIGTGLIAFLLWRFDINKILGNLRSLDPLGLVLTAVIYALFIIVSAWRWQLLLDLRGFKIPFPRTTIVYFISVFFNNFMPATLGGDMTRVMYSMPGRKADALAVVLVDRIIGFIGLFVFGLGAVLYLTCAYHRSEFLWPMVIGLAGLVVLTALLFSSRVYRSLAPLFARLRWLRIGERISNVHRAMTDFNGAWSTILACLALSIVVQGLLALAPFVVLRSMGVGLPGLLPFFLYYPIINVLVMIPLAPNGLGIREYFTVLLFGRTGLSPEYSLTMSLVSTIILFAVSLLGGIFFVLYRPKEVR